MVGIELNNDLDIFKTNIFILLIYYKRNVVGMDDVGDIVVGAEVVGIGLAQTVIYIFR